jgi:hypothetical protein
MVRCFLWSGLLVEALMKASTIVGIEQGHSIEQGHVSHVTRPPVGASSRRLTARLTPCHRVCRALDRAVAAPAIEERSPRTAMDRADRRIARWRGAGVHRLSDVRCRVTRTASYGACSMRCHTACSGAAPGGSAGRSGDPQLVRTHDDRDTGEVRCSAVIKGRDNLDIADTPGPIRSTERRYVVQA